MLCIVYQHYASTHQQKCTLNHKDQPSPSVNSSLKETLLLDPVRGHGIFRFGLCNLSMGFPDCSVGKESACNAGDLGSVPVLGRSPGEGKGYPLQYSGLENPMDCIVHGVAKSQTWLSNFHFFQPVNNPSFNVHPSISKNFYNCALTSCCS